MDSLRVVSLPPAYCLFVIAPASFSLLGCVCCANLKAPLTGPLRIPRATEYWKTAAYLPAEPLWLCELTPSQFAARHSVPEQSWFAFQWPWLPTTRFSRDGAAQLHITLAVDHKHRLQTVTAVAVNGSVEGDLVAPERTRAQGWLAYQLEGELPAHCRCSRGRKAKGMGV